MVIPKYSHDFYALLTAMVNNAAAILTAAGGAVLTVMNAYVIWQNSRNRKERNKEIEKIKGALGIDGDGKAKDTGT